MSSPDENDLPTLHSLHEPADLAEPRPDLYIRWSRGPAADKHGTSKDELTGVELPGLCAYPLASEDGGRIARFAHGSLGACSTTATSKSAAGMAFARGCWRARKLGRGPDNEPIVRCVGPWRGSTMPSSGKPRSR